MAEKALFCHRQTRDLWGYSMVSGTRTWQRLLCSLCPLQGGTCMTQMLNLIVIWEAWRSGQYFFALLCVHPTFSKHYFCHMTRGFACYGRLLLSRNIIQGGWRWAACHEEIFRWVLNVQITSKCMQILKVSQQN